MSDIFDHGLDAIDRMLNGEGHEYSDSIETVQYITCKFCREIKLHWQKTEAGWRLFNEENNLHYCDQYFIKE